MLYEDRWGLAGRAGDQSGRRVWRAVCVSECAPPPQRGSDKQMEAKRALAKRIATIFCGRVRAELLSHGLRSMTRSTRGYNPSPLQGEEEEGACVEPLTREAPPLPIRSAWGEGGVCGAEATIAYSNTTSIS